MLLPKKVENQQFTNINYTGTTLPPLVVDLNHDLEEIFFQLASATPHHY